MPYITSIERMSLEKGRQEGRQEGHQEGRQEGRQEGEMVMLRRLLTQRFGPLSDRVEQRLNAATVQDLERWADRVLDAQHLDEVFRDE
jgi:predicted transposase YdaD